MDKRKETTASYVRVGNKNQLENMNEEQQKNALEIRRQIDQLSEKMSQQFENLVKAEEKRRREKRSKE